jgi:hypothetical protein
LQRRQGQRYGDEHERTPEKADAHLERVPGARAEAGRNGRASDQYGSGQAVLVACIAAGSRWISRTASKSVLSILP